MYFPECFAMNAGISAMYFLKPPKSFTDRSSTKYAFIPYLALPREPASDQFAVRMEGGEIAVRDRGGALRGHHDADEIGRVPRTELLHDVGAVIFDRARADPKRASGFLVGRAGG